MSLPLPPKIEQRLSPAFRWAELLIRDWEWTWTKAGIFGLLFGFALLVTQAIVPSWFLYFANQKLRWTTFWLLLLRDAIATGWIGTWFAIFLIVSSQMQNIRRKVRGTTGATRPAVGDEVQESFAVFVVDDNACTRCSVCVDRCPTDVLYYARLPEDTGGTRTMAAVPTSQAADVE